MTELSKEYWNDRYNKDDFPWDIGHISTPLKEYFDQLTDKKIKILIPGAGNSYEAEYLHQSGFTNVFVLDYAQIPLDNFSVRVPSFPKEHLICDDFFNHHEKYDLIIEQTFFCAINPTLRKSYVEKMKELLAPSGKLVGLMFDDKLNDDKPPYGGSESEYRSLFERTFNILKMEKSKNSIGPRNGRELFVSFRTL